MCGWNMCSVLPLESDWPDTFWIGWTQNGGWYEIMEIIHLFQHCQIHRSADILMPNWCPHLMVSQYIGNDRFNNYWRVCRVPLIFDEQDLTPRMGTEKTIKVFVFASKIACLFIFSWKNVDLRAIRVNLTQKNEHMLKWAWTAERLMLIWFF